MKTIGKVENWRALRPTWRIGQGHWFVGLHAGNVMHGRRGAVGVWGRNTRQYGVGERIAPDSGLWRDEDRAGFVPAQHGSGLLRRMATRAQRIVGGAQ